MPERYPLSWPDRWPRTPAGQRGRAQFGKTESRFDAGTGDAPLSPSEDK